MAEQNAGSIVYDISADVLPLLQASRESQEALDKIDNAARSSGKGLDTLEGSSSKTGDAFSELAGYANSMDNQLKKLNTNVSGIARAMEEARSGTGGASGEFSRAQSIIEALGNQLAILEEAQENGGRSAAVLASQLRAGSSASEEEKKTIGGLAGAFYDMKEAADQAAKSSASIAAASRQADSSVSGLEKEVSILSAEMLAGSRTAAILAAQLSAGAGASDAQKSRIADLAGSLYDMREAQRSAATASAEAAKQLAQQANEANRISGITSDLSQQIAILSEQQTSGARSAAILAAQLRAGASATDADKQKIAQLTGQLYDMKTSVDTGTKSHGNWKTSMQQAGYQVNDFIVQVQGGQSALVAFSQQGSQLAGSFGPSGAVVGALIALGSVIAGVLITSLNGGKNAMDALKDAAEAMDKVISISTQGVAALSDKYAALARVNSEVATLLRNQALLEYNQAIAKIPKAISDASDAFITLGDRALAAIGGASPSIKKFNDELAALGVTSSEWGEAIQQANSQGQYASGVVSSLSATVNTLSSQLGIGKQEAFDLAKQLSNLSNNPSPKALNEITQRLIDMKSSSSEGQEAISQLAKNLTNLASEAGLAKIRLDALKESTDNLTAGQKNLIKQSERNLALSKLQGEARARLQAQFAAEDAGFSKDDPHAKQMEQDAAATYANTEAQRKLKSEQKKGASQQESIAQKLEKLRQQSELAAGSTQELSREQAILTAQQSLGKGATQEQITLAGKYAAEKWDTANAIKAQAAAEKLLPETKENASYKQSMTDLKTALDAQKISQQQYNQTSEQLEQQHQANLAKIRAQQVVSPTQSAAGEVDPVQRLANQHAQELALIKQFEANKTITEQQALALRNAANTQYEQQRIAAQWEIYRNQSTANELLAVSIEAMQSGATTAITGLLNGTQSLSEAFANLGTSVLNGLVSSLVQMGTQWVMSAMMGQAAQTTAIAANQAASTAALAASTLAGSAAAATLLASWSPAAMAASIATSGGAATAGLTGYTTAMTASKAMGLAGAREHGGPVSANAMYRVGEGGKPEIFKASNGSQYMIPGDNGKVISNRDMQGGGGAGFNYSPVIHVNGDPTEQQLAMLEAAVKRGAQQGYRMAVNDVASGKGKLSNALSNNFNTSQRLT